MRKVTKNYQKVIFRTKLENCSHKSRNGEGIYTFSIVGHTMKKSLERYLVLLENYTGPYISESEIFAGKSVTFNT